MLMVAMALAAAHQCPVAEARTLVGQRYDQHSRSRADHMAGDRPVRWIMEGSAVTQDWNPSRLNVTVGGDGRVSRVHCG